MIALKRARTESDIDDMFWGDKLVKTSLKLLRDQRAIRKGLLEKHSFNSAIWKNAKQQLLNETFDKCAYCEAPTAVVSYGDVEHYRPKSKYWWLAYCVDNYLASCAICNQRYKKAKFKQAHRKLKAPRVRSNNTDLKLTELSLTLVPDPLTSSSVDAFVHAHLQERPLLLNPYFDNPEKFFAWHADTVLHEVDLVPNQAEQDAEKYVRASEDMCGLNRSELKRLRFFFFNTYYTHKLTLLDNRISPETQHRIEHAIMIMLKADYPFAGMLRFFEGSGVPDNWKRDGFLSD